MSSPTDIQCSVCSSIIGETVDRCETCGNDVGAPNVRLVFRANEVAALNARYEQAIVEAEGRGAAIPVDSFEKAAKISVAVINMSVGSLQELLTRDISLYWNYHKGTRASTRKAATLANDRERLGVDATLFGRIGENLISAALSLECRGLVSYGPACIQLREVAIQHRCSLLEENSYSFVPHHGILAGQSGPEGYSSAWPDRHKLAVAKLAGRFESTTPEAAFQSILLQSNGDRSKDEFIEIQIYGIFDNKAIERISGPKPKTSPNIALWEVIKEFAGKQGKAVEEYS